MYFEKLKNYVHNYLDYNKLGFVSAFSFAFDN